MALSMATLATSSTTTFIATTPSKNKTSSFSFFLHKPSVQKRRIRCCLSHPRRPHYLPNRIQQDEKYVRVLDTTLRDGEQAPGAAMTSTQKLEVAWQLAKLGVDIMEVGFPASSKDDFETVKLIAKEVGNVAVDESGYVPVISACARCIQSDIDAVWESLKYAKRSRVNIFISTSEIHMKYKLRKSAEEVLKLAKDSVSYARSLGCEDIGFICEDAGRSNKEFLYHIYGEAIKAGATTITFTDTVGYNFPSEVAQFIVDMKANIVGIEHAVISVHCHNDLGLANANSLAAVHAGARQVEVTINGVGERAGNASLEEFVMAIQSRGKDVLEGLHTGINTKYITAASNMVEEYSGFSLQPHKAIVGANVFSHASGIHQDGVLKHKSTYEIISPEDIGLAPSTDGGIVLGKHSGRHALKSRLLELGYDLDGKKLDDCFADFKLLAGTKKHVSDNDIRSLVCKPLQLPLMWKLDDFKVSYKTQCDHPTATVRLIDINGFKHSASAKGVDQFSATCNAIDLIVKVPVKLLQHSTNFVTEKDDNMASATITITKANDITSSQKTVSGSADGDNVTLCIAKAYVDALNKMIIFNSENVNFIH